MSNDLVIASAGTGVFNPSKLATIKGLDENSPLRKMKTMGVPRLTVNGNRFIIKSGGTDQILKVGKKPIKELDVVIHSFSPDIQRQLSEKYDADQGFRGKGCWSNNGNTPDEDVWNKQSEDCDTCPEKMACSLSRNIVVSLYSPEGPVDNPMVFTTNWSSNSTKKAGEDMDEQLYSLINYLSMLSDNDVETYKIITRLVIDDFSDNTPANNCKVLFKPIDVLKPSSPNWAAHTRWEEEGKDLDKMIKIVQRPPEDETVGASSGADVEEEPGGQAGAKGTTGISAADAKKAAAAKRKKAAAAKKAKEAEEAKKAKEAEEEEVDLDDLDGDDEIAEGEFVEEDDDDWGDLDGLLDE